MALLFGLMTVMTTPAQLPSADFGADSQWRPAPQLWHALGDVLLTNAVFLMADRFVMNEPYSRVQLHSIHQNLRSRFVWDNDYYFVNHIGHPYQGSIFFNSARSKGYSLLQSVPFVVAGSLVWEYCGETERPSLNDMVTTLAGGTMWGEMTHRMTREVLDDGDTGGSRVAREVVAAVLNPMEAFHRLVSGRMWKVKTGGTAARQSGHVSQLRIAAGNRYAVGSHPATHGRHLPFVGIGVEYGGVDGEGHCQPYDFFDMDLQLTPGSEAFFSRLKMTGRLFSTPIMNSGKANGEVGLYQFYRYEDCRLADSLRGPSPFGETVALGPGMMLSLPRVAQRLAFDERLYLHGVVLGTVESDYYQWHNRHYNMGSGYALTAMSRLTWGNALTVQADAFFMHLFTWKGYETDVSNSLPADNGDTPNVLGDHSDARMLALDLQVQTSLAPHVGLAVGGSWRSRHTHYRSHHNRSTCNYELTAGLQWQF